MIGIQLLRISNHTGAAIKGVPAASQLVFPEGQIGAITLDQPDFRLVPNGGISQVGSTPGRKSKISGCSVVVAGAWASFSLPTDNVTIELGYLDNDGYFTVHLSSN